MCVRFFACLSGLLLPVLVLGQSVPPPISGTPSKAGTTLASNLMSSPTSASPGNISPTAPVITVAGICADGSTASSHCSITVSRKEFEELVDAIQPQMAPNQRQRLAVLYSQLLVFANAATHKGLDRTPEGEEALSFARLQALSQVLNRRLQADTSKVSPDDVQKYYGEHLKDFEEGTLERLYVPRNVQAAGKPVKEEDVQAEMSKLRARALQGESFATLQKQAYADLSLTGNPPATQLQKVRRGGLSSNLAGVFDLQPGVISQPVSEAGGIYIFRLISKRTLSAQDASADITSTLQTQRLKQALEQITATTKATFDNSYFGVTP